MSKQFEEPVDQYRIDGHYHCIADELIQAGVTTKHNDCGSSDAMSVYCSEFEDGSIKYSSYCFSCNQSFPQALISKSSIAEELGLDPQGIVVEKKEFIKKEKRTRITKDEIKEIMAYGYDCKELDGSDIRGIKEKYNKFFGHITKHDVNGKPIARFYPETIDGGMNGYKSRIFEGKKFGYLNKGITGIKNDLSGQVKFKDHTFRDILIVGGECFLPTAEVLTPNGWKTLQEVVSSKSDKVLQVNTDGTSEFVQPIGYTDKPFEGELCEYQNKFVHSLTTPNHNLVSVTGSGKWYKHKAIDGANSKPHKIPLVSNYVGGKGVNLTNDQLALIVAIAADSKVDVRKTKEDVVHFALVKSRKVVRLGNILNSLGIHSRNFASPLNKSETGKQYHTFNFELPSWIKKKGLPQEWLTELSEEQREFVLKEITFWDGNFVKDRNSTEFSSKLYKEADLIRNLAKLSGKHASLRKRSNHLGEWYAVKISWIKKDTSWQNLKGKANSVPYKGNVMCVTVPSGMIMVKQGELISVTGNCDKVAAFQMFDEYQERRWGDSGQEYLAMPVVSPTTGEASAIKQIRDHYDFINRAENIYLGLDNDEVGQAAMEEIAAIFPKEKIKIVSWSLKDPNNYINNKEGKDYSAQFIRDFYAAKPYFRGGTVSSIDADKMIEDELMRPKIPLPDFMQDLQKMMAGGIPLGYMVNFIAESGIGKSTLVNEAIRHMIFEADYKVGILSLELSAAQYMIAMLSREVGTKINLFETPQEALEFVRKPEVMEARRHLCMNEFGEERFTILDEREGSLSEVKKQCEELVNRYGCRILVIDPIQDLFEGVDMKEQDAFVKWMKVMLKNGVTFIDVCHVRKGNTSTDKEGRRILRELSEDDVHGISAIVKSAGANVFMSRNKYAEHPIEKNTTFVTLGKVRWTGRTGRVGSWYYDNDSHTMYDLVQYFKDNPDKLPSDYDLTYNPFTKERTDGFSMKAGSRNKGSSKKEDLPVDDFNLLDNVPL